MFLRWHRTLGLVAALLFLATAAPVAEAGQAAPQPGTTAEQEDGRPSMAFLFPPDLLRLLADDPEGFLALRPVLVIYLSGPGHPGVTGPAVTYPSYPDAPAVPYQVPPSAGDDAGKERLSAWLQEHARWYYTEFLPRQRRRGRSSVGGYPGFGLGGFSPFLILQARIPAGQLPPLFPGQNPPFPITFRNR